MDPDTMPATLDGELDALHEGRAFVDLSSWWKTSVAGTDAVGWLHDLLTADIASLRPGTTRRSLLLTPTGRIRADVHVARREDDLVLLQMPDQPDPVGRLLDPYVLSSDVRLEDLTATLALVALPGGAVDGPARASFVPSVLGPGGDAIVPAGVPAQELRAALAASGLVEVSTVAVEADRIRCGTARMGHDFDASSLPAEAGLEGLIDTAKGCFLGQESFARVRELGHPPRVLRRIRSHHRLRVGELVRAGGRDVGTITSAARAEGSGTLAIARVRWEAAELSLVDADGGPLDDVPQAF